MENKVDRILVDRARNMRKMPTEEENKMWYLLLKGTKPRFLRQRVIGKYIVDFCCPKLKLIIEIDGEQHYMPENKAYEDKRTFFLENKGYKILRFYNSEINNHISDVEKTITAQCYDRARELGIDIELKFR